MENDFALVVHVIMADIVTRALETVVAATAVMPRLPGDASAR